VPGHAPRTACPARTRACEQRVAPRFSDGVRWLCAPPTRTYAHVCRLRTPDCCCRSVPASVGPRPNTDRTARAQQLRAAVWTRCVAVATLPRAVPKRALTH
jgi:hypothetical protein